MSEARIKIDIELPEGGRIYLQAEGNSRGYLENAMGKAVEGIKDVMSQMTKDIDEDK